MEYKGIIITGTNAAGKSTIALKVCEKFKEFQIVQAVIIRKPRKKVNLFFRKRRNNQGQIEYYVRVW